MKNLDLPNRLTRVDEGSKKPREGEPVFQKNVNSGFIGTQLEVTLRKNRISDLCIMGFTTDHCVSTTTRMAANLGFQVSISADAVCTFDRQDHEGVIVPADVIHRTALASLHREFATVVPHIKK